MSLAWVNHGLASQRDVLLMLRGALPGHAVAASHCQDREDVLGAADLVLPEPPREDASYADAALEVASANGVRLLVATRGRGFLAAARDRFEAVGVRLACGARDAGAIALCDRKDLFAAAMGSAGLPVPATRLAADAEGLRAALGDLSGDGRTLCVKPAEGVYGRGFWILDGRAALMDALMDRHLAGAPRLLPPDVLAQAMGAGGCEPVVVMEYLPGVEHSVDLACDDGDVVALACRRKEPSLQVVTDSGPEAELARAAARALRLDGLVNVQTRAGADGLPRLLEVNTRASGGIAYAAAAGIDVPGALGRRLLGLPPLPAPRGGRPPTAIRVLDAPLRLDRATAALRRAPVAA